MNHHRLLMAALLCGVLPISNAQGVDGKTLFQKNCAACHQANGKGIPGAFPALAGNELVLGPPTEAVTVLLTGRGGMPDFSANLSDHDIAQVLSYVRASWGNTAAAVPEAEVASLRTSLRAAKAGTARLSNKH